MRIDSPKVLGALTLEPGSEAILTGSFTGSFVGDGSGISGVTAEWDGSHTGNADITGDLAVTGEVSAATFVGDGSGLTNVAPLAGTGIDVTGTTVSVDATIATAADLTSHVSDTTNPHSVTATQVGLGNVDNTSDANKPVSTAQQAALDLKATVAALDTEKGRVDAILLSADADKDSFAEIVTLINSVDTSNDSAFASHATNTSNPHSVTKAQVGLGNVDNTADSAKPVSTAQQTALDLKYDASNPSGYISSYVDTTYSAGTGVTLTGTTFSIGQSVGTGDTVQFGTVRATADIVAYYSSDERLKDNMVPLAGALDKVKAMGGYSFDWNDKQDIYEAGSHSIGVKAQEVQAQYPELVHEREDKYLSVDYVKLTAVLLEAVKELSAKVEALENK